MMEYRWTAIVTIVALLVYIGLGLQVAKARGTSGIEAPAMTGHPILERAVRVHINTLEWLPIFLTALWLFAIYWNEKVAAGLGVRVDRRAVDLSNGYMADPAKRSTGFLIQALTTLVFVIRGAGEDRLYFFVIAASWVICAKRRDVSRLFQRALQRVLVLAREVHHLADLGLGDFVGEHAHTPTPFW